MPISALTVLAMCATLHLSAPRSASAQQTLHGTIRDSLANTALSGAVVAALAGDGSTIARTITGSAGEFRLTAGSSPTRLRVIHIGYQPRELSLPFTSDSALLIRLARSPAVLDVVHISTDELCPQSSSNNAAFQVWQRARAGLLAAIVTREANPALDTTLQFKRSADPSNAAVRQQTVVRHIGQTTRPFTAPSPPNRLARDGYMLEDATGRTFFLPDADVLLDDSFAGTHCFRATVGDATHPNQVGLAFHPIGRLNHAIDIAGTIWLDSSGDTLRSVAIHYTGVDVGPSPSANVDFVNAPNGATLISRWAITIPIVTLHRAGSSPSPGGRVTSRSDEVDVEELYVAGGQTMSAHWRDGSMWRAPIAGVVGDVIDQRSRRPVAHALVTFDGTSDTLSTDSLGHFESRAMLPARYTIRVTDTSLAAYGRDRTDARVIDVASGALTSHHAELPSYDESVMQLCRRSRSESSPGMIVGHVSFLQSDTAVGARDVRLRVSWPLEYVRTPANAGMAPLDVAQDVSIDARGRFVVCGVPMDQRIDLHLTTGTRSADTSLTIVRDTIKLLNWAPFRPR